MSTLSGSETAGAQLSSAISDSLNAIGPGLPQRYVPQLVVVRAGPQEPALVADNEVITYAELDRRSNRLAHCLRGLGVERDTLVGICLERSVSWVISSLAIMKAGGAYLPLEPGYPTERLAFMLNDAHTPLLLTQQRLGERLRGNWQTLDVDDLLASDYPVTWTDRGDITGDDLAYVIYTSGSTGRPKGVQITHDSLLNLVLWHQQAFGVKAGDRATQLASPGFDAAAWEVWPYLAAGASVHMVADVVRNQPTSLRDWLVAHGITITFVPTPLAERMITLPWPRHTALRFLLTGADTLHGYPPSGLPFTLVNNYGPTECTVVASSGAVPSNECPSELPSIGSPIANTEIHILDEQMRRVPVGTTGELYIGGAGVARGYINHVELTAERFISNPFSSNSKDRLYRSGDLGRYLPNGQIAFVGRIDDQIKIRGYRIEPSEIIAALNRHSEIAASHVVASEDPLQNKQLVAYLVPRYGSQLSYRALRDFLGKLLPDYMIPSIFVLLESLPVTANGKVDRERLPRPDAANLLEEAATLPQTGLEPQVAAILASLLKLKHVDINDNFFLLGGHSLLGIQVIARIYETFGIELPLYRLFEAPTVAELSSEIDRLLLAKAAAMSQEEAERMLGTDAASGTEKL
ncbi:MAG: non-ribosomal peptide synthetase [Candidatus Sulfotelmatobacter sp.]